MFGLKPPHLLTYCAGTSVIEAVDYDLRLRDEIRSQLQSNRQLSLGRRSSHKLGLRYYGLFEVVERIGTFAYKLLLPSISNSHPLFHISLLKSYEGDSSIKVHPLPESSLENRPLHTPLVLLDKRTIMVNEVLRK